VTKTDGPGGCTRGHFLSRQISQPGFLVGLFWFNVMARHMVKNHWFVSVEMPKQRRKPFARQTKTFPTEAEAKQFGKEMLSNKYKIVAGTLLSADQPARRFISGSQLYRWIEEEDAGH
jgi:hypothetical protein